MTIAKSSGMMLACNLSRENFDTVRELKDSKTHNHRRTEGKARKLKPGS